MTESEIQEIHDGGSTSTPSKKRKRATKQVAPAKKWCFTLNNWTPSDVDVFEDTEHDAVPVMIFQSEIGENKTSHLQGYLEFETKRRPIDFYGVLLKHKRTHWEVARGTREENVAYCSKDDTWDKNLRYRRGLPQELMKLTRDHMRANQLAIADDYKDPEDPLFGREIHWYWEAEGGWGKSILTKFMVHNMGAILLGGANKDALYGIAAYVQKNGEGPPIVIFDIPRVNKGGVSYQSLEYIKNGMFFNGKYESGMVMFNCPHVIVFANSEPEYEKMSSDRWSVKELSRTGQA